MEGILNFIITKIRPLLYKIISSYCQTFFYGFLFKKKKISQTRIENFRSKKKKKFYHFSDSSLVIVTNNRKSISSRDSRGVPIESSLHNRISKVFLFVYPVPRKGRSSPGRPIERDIRFYECLASRLRLLEKKKAATGKNRKTRIHEGKGTVG